MAKMTNRSARPIHIGDIMLVPGVETDVPDDLAGRKTVQYLIENGDIQVGGSRPQAEPKGKDGDSQPKQGARA